MRLRCFFVLAFFIVILNEISIVPTVKASCIAMCFESKIQVDSCNPVVLPNGLKGKELTGKIIEEKQVKCDPRQNEKSLKIDNSYVAEYRKNAREFFSTDESDCSQLSGKIVEQFSGDECCDTMPPQGYCAAKGMRVRFTPTLIKNIMACDEMKNAESCYLVWQQGMKENPSVYEKEDTYLKKSCDLDYQPACKVVEERAQVELQKKEETRIQQKERSEYIQTACQGDWENVDVSGHCLMAARMAVMDGDYRKAVDLYRIACDKKGNGSLQGCFHAQHLATNKTEKMEFYNKAKAHYDQECPSHKIFQIECEMFKPELPKY